MTDPKPIFRNPELWQPELRKVIEENALDPMNLSVGLPFENERIPNFNRTLIQISDGQKTAAWKTDSIRKLFRGNEVPPDLADYPKEYVPYFFFIESHLLTADSVKRNLRDREMEDIYSNLRRRPDGRSLGPIHDFVWQVAAILLALHPLSQAQYEGILGRLAVAARTFAVGPTSRNYFDYLHSRLGGQMED